MGGAAHQGWASSFEFLRPSHIIFILLILRHNAELPLYSCAPTLASVSYRRRAAFILGRILGKPSILKKRLTLIFQNPLSFTSFFRNFATKVAKFFAPLKETSLSRQKKKRVSLFCSQLSVTLASPKFMALGNEKKNELFFCIALVFS
jgi:hypothetical protein